METDQLISVSEFCVFNNIELSFINSLYESGLIDTASVEEEIFVPLSQLNQLEKLMRLYTEMDINIEGIETITYLLQRINEMQHQILQLKNKLTFYESL